MAGEVAGCIRPSLARMSDALVGGVHNFGVDRAAANLILTAMPRTTHITTAGRAFRERVVRDLVDLGVRQFLDIGCGIVPSHGAVHQLAQESAPEARVVYVDDDPVAVHYAQQLLTGNGRATAICDEALLCPQRLVEHPDLCRLLDLTQPVGVLMISVLQFIPDTAAPYTAVAQLRDALATGSYLAVSHALYEDVDDAVAGRLRAAYRAARLRVVLRRRAEIAQFLTGLDLIEPGVVDMTQWRPVPAEDGAVGPWQTHGHGCLAAVGRKR